MINHRLSYCPFPTLLATGYEKHPCGVHNKKLGFTAVLLLLLLLLLFFFFGGGGGVGDGVM